RTGTKPGRVAFRIPRRPGRRREEVRAGRRGPFRRAKAPSGCFRRETLARSGADMTDQTDPHGVTEAVPQRAVIVGVIPDQPTRVLREAARYAALFSAPLIIAHVDVSRFVTYEDPDGYVHSAPIDIDLATGEAQLNVVRETAESVLTDV